MPKRKRGRRGPHQLPESSRERPVVAHAPATAAADYPTTVEIKLAGRRVLRVSAWEGAVWLRTGTRLGPSAVQTGAVVSLPVERAGALRDALLQVARDARSGAPRL
jgi:hypothetical protein